MVNNCFTNDGLFVNVKLKTWVDRGIDHSINMQ